MTAGSGISISGLTITNSGILSLTAGTDISVSGSTIADTSTLSTVRGRGGCSSCITSADLDTVSATVGGTGLTTYTKGDLIYSSASNTLSNLGIGTAGQLLTVVSGIPAWNSTIYIDTANGNVGIGTTSPQATLDVAGTVQFGGNLTLSNGRINSDLLPAVTNTYNLGSADYKWDQLYLKDIAAVGGQATFTGLPTGASVSDGSIYINPASTPSSSDTVFGVAVGGVEKLRMDASGNITIQGNVVGPSNGSVGYWSRNSTPMVYPSNITDDVATLGNVGVGTTNPVYTLDVSGTLNATGAATLGSTLGVTGLSTFTGGASIPSSANLTVLGTGNNGVASSLIPISNSYNLGAVSYPWGTLYAGNIVTGSSGISGYWQRISGSLAPTNISDSFNLGSTATSSAYVHLAGTSGENSFINTGNVGIGTTNPSSLFSVGSSSQFQVDSSGDITEIGGAAHTISNSSGALSIDSATTGAINIGTGANAKTITIGNNTGATALAFNSGTGSQTFASSVVSGTTTSSGFVFTDNTTLTGTEAYIGSTGVTTGTLLNIDTGAANTLTSGNLLSLTSVSTGLTTGSFIDSSYTGTAGFTGNLNYFDYSPGSLPGTAAAGDILRINLGANGSNFSGNLFNVVNNSSSIFSVSQTAMTTSIPADFNAAGDVSLAYDLNFSNPTASYAKSEAPLYLQAGETFNSSDLTLKTFNAGNVIVDSQALVANYSATVSSQLVVGTANSPANIGNFYLTNDQTYGKALAILNQTESQDIFTASSSGTTRFVIQNGGNVGIGTASPDSLLDVNSLFNVLSGGNVGIGTTNPGYNLDLQASVAATAAAQFFNTNTGANADGLLVKLGFTGNGTAPTSQVTGNSFIRFVNGGGIAQGSIDSNGSGGIAYQTGGVDLAEYFKKADPSESLPAGTLVCISSNGGVTACSTNGSNKIVGVVSDTPGFVGGSNHAGDPNYVLVGMVGQLPVKVVSGAVIAAGDPLTLSATAGQAEEATASGQIAGHALGTVDANGNVLTAVNVSWYDPSVYITANGNLSTMADLQNKVDLLQTSVSSLQGIISSNASLSALLLQNPISTQSANFENLNNLNIKTATVSGSLMVLGRTTTTDLGVTGTIQSGLLSIDGLDPNATSSGSFATINTLAGDLYLQNEGLGGINMLEGKVLIDTNGNIVTSGEITAAKINISADNQESASIGKGIVSEGKTSVYIPTSSVSDKSLIFLTPTSPTGKQELYISSENPGSGFTVSMEIPYTKDVDFNWWIVDKK